MAGKMITLKWAAKCADCGATIPAGTTARWYGKGRVYGRTCHGGTKASGYTPNPAPYGSPSAYAMGDDSPGARASHYDRSGVYGADGTYWGRADGRRCEDAPCCGCCP